MCDARQFVSLVVVQHPSSDRKRMWLLFTACVFAVVAFTRRAGGSGVVGALEGCRQQEACDGADTEPSESRLRGRHRRSCVLLPYHAVPL